jgi:hypothetical protein
MIMAALLEAKKEASMCSRLCRPSAMYPTSSQAFFSHFFDSIFQTTRRSFSHAWHGKCNVHRRQCRRAANQGTVRTTIAVGEQQLARLIGQE